MDYKTAGVNIDIANDITSQISKKVQSSHNKYVIGKEGSFCGLYDLEILKNYKKPILAQSTDGVGTKMSVACQANYFDTIGYDLVSACVNDILVVNALPFTFLDYVASSHLEKEIIIRIINSIATACKKYDIALVGGETAEMPGVYQKNEIDLVGTVNGVVDHENIPNTHSIQRDDIILGIASNGLHTNGYSLARQVLFNMAGWNIATYNEELQCSIGEALLMPHTNYMDIIKTILHHNIKVKGMAHITGGGLIENIARILPHHLSAHIYCNKWDKLPLFNIIQNIGNIRTEDMYRTFNMGIGYVIIVDKDHQDIISHLQHKHKAYTIGEIKNGNGKVKLL